jgi:hypothetical protein
MKLGSVRMYAPEQWGSLQKFNKFYSGTYSLCESGKRSVSGAINHFHKGLVLKDLALKLIPNLEADEDELNQRGHTHAINAKELSAVVEGVILELYSSVDCTRKVISEIYKDYQGIPDSTRKFFNKVRADEVDKRFPEELRIAVKEADWYEGFRRIRDELTHLDTGRCMKDRDTGKIRYMHSGFIIDGKCLIINDIFHKLEQTIVEVNQFIGRVFAYLLTQLKDERMSQICGIFDSRVYTRYVSPSEAVDFNGGVCESKLWFDLEENPTCIFADNCGAYKNGSA